VAPDVTDAGVTKVGASVHRLSAEAVHVDGDVEDVP
jgi:hypothetical protein